MPDRIVRSPRKEYSHGTVFPPPPARPGIAENLWLAKRHDGEMAFFDWEVRAVVFVTGEKWA